ncbi:MAG: MFS transporter [Gammaproteobacteria bacterium]
MDQTDAVPTDPTALSPLRYPVFRAVWAASIVSNLGGLIQSVGASWLMLSIANSAAMVALVQSSVALPVVLLSLAAGAIADNHDRRVVMLSAQIFMLTVSVALTVCAWAGLITPWLLLSFTFLIGCGTALSAPAWQASVGDMVPRTELAGAITLNSLGFNIARSVGPAIGGMIVAAAGAAAAFAVNAASYAALITVLSRWRPARDAQVLPRESLGVAMAAGVRYVTMSPAIRTVLLRSVIFGSGASGLIALMPVVAKDLLGGGPLVYGVMLGAFGAGAVLGAIAAARLRHDYATEIIVRWACIAFAVAAVVAGLSTWLPLTMAGLLLAGAGWVLALATLNVTVQLSAPRWVVGRALALYQMAAFGGLAGGSWLWGEVAHDGNITLSLFGGAAVLLACAAFGLWRPLAPSADVDLDPLRHWEEPDTAVPVAPRTGPVVITVEYVIRQDDQLRFLAAMAERRRIRRRDGGLNWRLLRDLSDPEVWVERYETPTWLDYLRLSSRLTRDDATVPESLRALHQGDGPPRIRRMIERSTAAPPVNQVSGQEHLAVPLSDTTQSS